jgi:hypothetical protein
MALSVTSRTVLNVCVMFTLRLFGRALVFAHHALMAIGALYACLFAAMVALVIVWEALSWIGGLIALEH